MELENNIVLGASCDVDQQNVVDMMPLLHVGIVASFLGGGSANVTHYTVGQKVIDNRYTYYGYKDYMYCYINCQHGNAEVVVSTICNYILGLTLSTKHEMRMFMKLFYSCVLLTVVDSRSGYGWRFFNGKLWITVDKHQIRNMLNSRLSESQVLYRLNINPDAFERTRETMYKSITSDSYTSMFFSCDFESMINRKDRVFCMSTSLYDMVEGSVRRPLPGDLCTLSGNIDPIFEEDVGRLREMMDVLSMWMGGPDVADSYMNILAGALSEFAPRYAIINSGTGADGKSTFFHIIDKLFGSYCMTMPTTGPAVDSKGANEATPAVSAMVGRRVCITTDANNVDRLISSSGFKSVSGGDKAYVRRLFREADTEGQRLKMLILVATNQTDIVVTSIHELTRIRIIKWMSKRVSTEDRDIIPLHQISHSGNVIHRYENVFIERYGHCMMMDLISRHKVLLEYGMRIDLCLTIREWTKSVVAPKTILKFLNDCTERVTPNVQQVDDVTRMALTATSNDMNASVESLYISYMLWRKNGARFSKSDPTTMEGFRTHLEFYHQIHKRLNSNGDEELYVNDIKLKQNNDVLSMIYMTGGKPLTLNTTNPILYTDNSVYMPNI